jgi:uncharacterized membrane protein (TIGR02234 family)
MTGRRGLLVALAGCVLGGALVLLAAGRVWGSALLTAETGARTRFSVTGHAVVPALPALGLAVLVCAGALIAARSWLRRVVGLLLVVLGGAVASVAVTSGHDVAAALRHRAFGVQHAAVPASLSGWAVLAAVGGGVAVLAGALTVVAGGGWPAMGARYESPAAREAAVPAGEVAEPAVAWDALDRGDDPTV